MKNKIIFFHPYFRNGGVERTNIRLSRYFIEKGYEVEFLSLFFEGQIVDEAKACEIRLVPLGEKRTRKAITKIRKYIKQEKKSAHITIISCQNYANLVMWFALVGIRDGVKLIFTERNHPVSLQQYAPGLKSILTILLMKCIYRHADKVVAISQELADDLSKMVHVPVSCIYNPTYSEDFSKMAEEEVADQWFEQDKPIVLSVGRLEKQKDFVTLIKAFAKVKACMECRLVLVGDGSQREKLEKIVDNLNLKENVKILGFDPNPYKYMVRADLFVVSSIYEGLCNTVIEATALKTPCVVTDCKSGPKEILLYGDGGKVVNVGDVDAMADAILWVLNHENDARLLMEKAYRGLSRFTLEATGSRYLDIIENNISGEI